MYSVKLCAINKRDPASGINPLKTFHQIETFGRQDERRRRRLLEDREERGWPRWRKGVKNLCQLLPVVTVLITQMEVTENPWLKGSRKKKTQKVLPKVLGRIVSVVKLKNFNIFQVQSMTFQGPKMDMQQKTPWKIRRTHDWLDSLLDPADAPGEKKHVLGRISSGLLGVKNPWKTSHFQTHGS